MVVQEIRDAVLEQNPEAKFFDGPSFDRAVVGVTYDGRVIYDYEKMLEEVDEDSIGFIS